ncbi:MAG: ATP-binding protein [Atopobiaceae bacterium]|nr:ATP-binding protein [Atopobiaceae bacterium]
MLIRLTVGNYKSFNEETEMPMVSSSKIRMMQGHVIQSDGIKLLKHAAVYGANASGKTNLIDCFRFVQHVLNAGLPLKSTNLYCRNDPKNKDRYSLFELQFSIGGHYYAYGFTAILSQRKITKEWLYELHRNSTEPLIERIVEDRSILTALPLSGKSQARFETYKEDFLTNDAGLFLSELNRAKRFDEGSPLIIFKRVFDWLTQQVMVIGPTEPVMADRYHDYLFNKNVRKRIEQTLSSFDTGVSGIELDKLTNDELLDIVPSPLLRRIIEDVQKRFTSAQEQNLAVTIRGETSLTVIQFRSDGEMEAIAVRLRHKGSRTPFDFSEESDGTRRLFDLIVLLLAVGDDMVFIVDELERSLHPMLVRRLLTLFMELNEEHSAQLVFSTHEASIMRQDLFRRDEIWFVDRDLDGNSRLYSLDRFKERFDKDISKAYLEGRYGAVPVFGELKSSNGGLSHAARS